MTDPSDILSLNHITKDSMEEYRKKYANKPFVQEFFFDNWFSKYFKANKGKYLDPLVERKTEFDLEEEITIDIQKDEL